MFKNMGGSIPGGNFPGGSLMGRIFLVGVSLIPSEMYEVRTLFFVLIPYVLSVCACKIFFKKKKKSLKLP